MPQLAAVAAVATQQPPADDDAAADAHIAMQVHEIVEADSRTTLLLRLCAEVGLVAHRHRQAEAEPVAEFVAERLVDPAEIGPVPHHPVPRPDHAAVRRAHADAAGARRGRPVQLPPETGEDRYHVVQVRPGARTYRLPPVQDHPAESDPGGDQPVHGDVEGQDVAALGDRSHHQGRAAGTAGVHRRPLIDEAGPAQLGGQRHDGAAIQAHPFAQLDPGQRATQMHLPQQRAGVAPADLLLDQSDLRESAPGDAELTRRSVSAR